VKRVLLFTCEHGGARVPRRYQRLFRSAAAQAALQSHRGSDHGALSLARSLARDLGAPLFSSTVTRLLVDLNRSVGHPQLYSELSKALDSAEREHLLERYYFPHRERVESWIARRAASGSQVLHIGVHSFVPRIDGHTRRADIGLLYDPARLPEKRLCARWKTALEQIDPGLRVRRNYPYSGKADGLVTHLRRVFSSRQYLGIEIEANQALLATVPGRRRAAGSVATSIRFLDGRVRAGC
jgi:predicted N-formylglutamate amidohydrolase